MKIKNKNIFITGGNRGIGKAVALEAAKRGANIHLIIRSNDETLIQEMKDAGASTAKIWLTDLGQRSNVESLINDLKDQDVDLLFNNAGLLTGGLIEEQPLDDIYAMLHVNVNALIHLTRGVLPRMIQRGQGKIINNSSVSAYMHFPCASTYAASKAAVAAFTDCIQHELRNTGVSTLLLITPGIKTRMFDEIDAKYSKNFEVPTDSISTEEYAVQICDAIERDDERLEPKGATGIGLFTARHIPFLFNKEVQRRFKR